MKFILKNISWINLLWLLLVLITFKFYNGFVFKNNESIYFIISILIVPITLTIISLIDRKKKLKKYQLSKTYVDEVNKRIQTDFEPPLREITKVVNDNKSIIFGTNLNGIIQVHQTYIEVSIKGTSVSYKYYFGKVISDYLLYDRRGYETKDVKVLFHDVLLLIKSLLDEQLIYQETTKRGRIIYARLLIGDNIKYLYSYKDYKKTPKIKKEFMVEL